MSPVLARFACNLLPWGEIPKSENHGIVGRHSGGRSEHFTRQSCWNLLLFFWEPLLCVCLLAELAFIPGWWGNTARAGHFWQWCCPCANDRASTWLVGNVFSSGSQMTGLVGLVMQVCWSYSIEDGSETGPNWRTGGKFLWSSHWLWHYPAIQMHTYFHNLPNIRLY